MARLERQPENQPQLSEKEARRNFKLAESLNNSYIDRRVNSGRLHRALSRRLYGFGLKGFATRLAPEEVAFLDFLHAEDKYKSTLLEDALNTAYRTSIRQPFPQGEYKPRHLHLVEPQENEIPQDTVVEVARTLSSDKSSENDVEKQEENPYVPHWSEWNVWREEKQSFQENEEEVETPFQYFDETEKQVAIIKRTQYTYEAVPQTNETLAQFVEERARKLGGDGWSHTLSDLQTIVAYVINTPVGRHSKKINDATIGIDKKSHQLYRADPRKIPHNQFLNPNSKTLRMTYYWDHGAVIISEILPHEEMTRKYGSRRKD